MMKKRGPVPIGNVVADLLSRRGLGRPQAATEIEKIWSEVVGDAISPMTRCGKINRQQLNVIVTNSTIMQELVFRKQEIVEAFNKKAEGNLIKDIRFRVGRSSSP